jgi:hypothetical protein
MEAFGERRVYGICGLVLGRILEERGRDVGVYR